MHVHSVESGNDVRNKLVKRMFKGGTRYGMMCIQEVADRRLRIRNRLTCPHMHTFAIKRKEHLRPTVPVTGCGHLMSHTPGMIRCCRAHWPGVPSVAATTKQRTREPVDRRTAGPRRV